MTSIINQLTTIADNPLVETATRDRAGFLLWKLRDRFSFADIWWRFTG